MVFSLLQHIQNQLESTFEPNHTHKRQKSNFSINSDSTRNCVSTPKVGELDWVSNPHQLAWPSSSCRGYLVSEPVVGSLLSLSHCLSDEITKIKKTCSLNSPCLQEELAGFCTDVSYCNFILYVHLWQKLPWMQFRKVYRTSSAAQPVTALSLVVTASLCTRKDFFL